MSQYAILVSYIIKHLIIANQNAPIINITVSKPINVLIALKELLFILKITPVLNYAQEIKHFRKSIIHVSVPMATTLRITLVPQLSALLKSHI